MAERCPRCAGPAVRLMQTGALSCVAQCDEKLLETTKRIALEERTATFARALGEATPEGVGFCLVMFEYREGGGIAFASTAEREDTIAALQELVDKMKLDTPPMPTRGGTG